MFNFALWLRLKIFDYIFISYACATNKMLKSAYRKLDWFGSQCLSFIHTLHSVFFFLPYFKIHYKGLDL